jgi:acetyl-CoA C-acetyltransferase
MATPSLLSSASMFLFLAPRTPRLASALARRASSSASWSRLQSAVPALPRGVQRPRAPVYLAGSGLAPVTRKRADTSLAGMGGAAVRAALADAGLAGADGYVGALYVGNMLSGMLSQQQHLGPLLANAAGLRLVESATAEACCGAGGAALRWGYLAVASGAHETVVVAGVEHMTHVELPAATRGLAAASHWASEGARGETFVSLNGAIMREYMRRYGVAHAAFAPFPVTAHANALSAAHATLKVAVTPESYEASRAVAAPIQLLDASPICDGAAAVVLTSSRAIAAGGGGSGGGGGGALVVRVAGSAAATDDLAVAARPDMLHLAAVAHSTESALAQAGLSRADVGIFELHDAYAIMACVSLESAGFAPAGEGTGFAADGHLALGGRLPIATFGGLKARGHPVGATGVYQAAEMHRQLTRRAGANQVAGARVALTQNIGGSGASVFTHAFVVE